MELTLEQVNGMREQDADRSRDIQTAFVPIAEFRALLDLAEQALLMKAALSPERAEAMAKEFGHCAVEWDNDGFFAWQQNMLDYAKAAGGEK